MKLGRGEPKPRGRWVRQQQWTPPFEPSRPALATARGIVSPDAPTVALIARAALAAALDDGDATAHRRALAAAREISNPDAPTAALITRAALAVALNGGDATARCHALAATRRESAKALAVPDNPECLFHLRLWGDM